MFIFDALGFAGRSVTLEAPREEEFSPVKNSAAALSIVILNILIGTLRAPTPHNLWPLEIVLWSAGGLVYLGALFLIRKIHSGRAVTAGVLKNPATSMTSQTDRKILLIGWDAADWKIINPLLDAGKTPNLEQLVERGVMGNLSTLYPELSPMLWTSIATGKRPFNHGIHGFTEPDSDGQGVRPVTRRHWPQIYSNLLHECRQHQCRP